jgi:DNA-binding transcriptional ArsR family regulator
VTPLTHYTGVVGSTGEIIDVVAPAIRGGRKRKGRRKVYALVDLQALAMLELSAVEWAVLHRVMSSVATESNESRVQVQEIAADLEKTSPNVSRAMRELRARRIITTRRRGVHKVNSHIMFRGSNQDWDIATESEKEPVWSRP